MEAAVASRRPPADMHDVVRKMLALFTPEVIQKTSIKEVSEAIGEGESAVGRAKRILEFAGVITTTWGPNPAGKGKTALWTVHANADEALQIVADKKLSFTEATVLSIAKPNGDGEDHEPVDDDTSSLDMSPAVYESTKSRIFNCLSLHSDSRGNVRDYTWAQLQSDVGSDLHTILHLLRSLRGEGRLRLGSLPKKLSRRDVADKALVIASVVGRDMTRPGNVPEHAFGGPVTRSYPTPDGTLTMDVRAGTKPIYVPYLSPAGPVPDMPEADRILAQVSKWRTARAALLAAGEEKLAGEIDKRIEALSPMEKELLTLAAWVRKTASAADNAPSIVRGQT